MASGVVWMSLDQIDRRVALLATAEAARVLRGTLSREETRDQFVSALSWVVILAIRYALRQFEAAGKSAAVAGGAPVPNDCVAIFAAMNGINKAEWARLTTDESSSV